MRYAYRRKAQSQQQATMNSTISIKSLSHSRCDTFWYRYKFGEGAVGWEEEQILIAVVAEITDKSFDWVWRNSHSSYGMFSYGTTGLRHSLPLTADQKIARRIWLAVKVAVKNLFRTRMVYEGVDYTRYSLTADKQQRDYHYDEQRIHWEDDDYRVPPFHIKTLSPRKWVKGNKTFRIRSESIEGETIMV